MKCEHKRIYSRNCEYYCLDCGEKLDAAAIIAANSKNQPDNTGDESGAGKTTRRKRNAKNG